MPPTTNSTPDEPVEEALARLVPAATPPSLAQKLTAAHPAGPAAQHDPAPASRPLHRQRGSRDKRRALPRFARWTGAAAAAVALALVLATIADRPDRAPADPVTSATPGAGTTGAGAENPENPPASAATAGDQLFLPVASNRRIVGVRPAYFVQLPDEAPRRIAEVIWVEEVTAVGAEADDTLHLERTGSTLVPVDGQYY